MNRRAREPSLAQDIHVALPGVIAFGVSIALAVDLVTLKLVGFDLAAYILAARRVLSGEPLYQNGLTALGPFGQYIYPPFVVVPFLPAAMVPFDVARGTGLALLALVAALLLWHLVSGLPRSTRYWGAAAMTLFFPLIWEVTLENLTLVTLAFCILAWRVRHHPGRSGAALAVAIGLKLLPFTLIAFFAAARLWRPIAWSAVVLILLVVVTWPVVGAEWPAFLGLVTYLANAAPGTGSNIVPVLFAAPQLRLILPALAGAIAILCGVIARGQDGREEASFRVALAAVPLLASTLWYPYLVFALPLLLFGGARPPVSALRVPFAIVRPGAWVLMQWEALRDPGREFVLPLVGLLLLIAAGLLELIWTPRREPVHATSDGSPRARLSWRDLSPRRIQLDTRTPSSEDRREPVEAMSIAQSDSGHTRIMWRLAWRWPARSYSSPSSWDSPRVA